MFERNFDIRETLFGEIMKTLMTLVMFFFSILAQAKLTSINSVKSFDCTLTSAAGYTRLQYDSEKGHKVTGQRNGFYPVQYSVNSAGIYGTSTKSHISLSGGALSNNQYLSMLFNSILPSGDLKASGSLLLVTMGGSTFAPVMLSGVPVGTVSCASVSIK